MSHRIIILREKLDCIATNFPSVATNANNLKAKCNATDEYILANDTEQSETFHEVLEAVQIFATSACDNGIGSMTTTELGEALDGFSGQLYG